MQQEPLISPYVYVGLVNYKKFDKQSYAETIIRIVSNYYGLSIIDLRSSNRKHRIVKAKQVCIYFLRTRIRALSLNDIAQLLGDKHHTTIIHSIKTIENYLSINDKEITNDVSILSKIILLNKN